MALVANGTYFGRALRVRHRAGLALAETQYEPGAVVPQHEHETALCVLVLEGAFEERSFNQEDTCAAGMLLFLPEGAAHSHRFLARRSRAFTIQFGAEWRRRFNDCGLQLPACGHLVTRGRESWNAARVYRAFRSDDAAELAMDEAAVGLLDALANFRRRIGSEGAAQWLSIAREYVRAHYRDTFSLAHLARLTGMHPAYLSRAFHRQTGETLSAFMRRLRLEHAAERLVRDHASIGFIGIEAGFADHSHFTREFKRATGTTPQAYRELFSPKPGASDPRAALSP